MFAEISSFPLDIIVCQCVRTVSPYETANYKTFQAGINKKANHEKKTFLRHKFYSFPPSVRCSLSIYTFSPRHCLLTFTKSIL